MPKLATFIISLALLIASFILPPCGIIDNSVLTAVGEIFVGYFILFELKDIIAEAKHISLKRGETEINITKKDTE